MVLVSSRVGSVRFLVRCIHRCNSSFRILMDAFDRDGTVIGSLTDYKANHPGLIQKPEDQKLIEPVARYINRFGGIIISNQDGPIRYRGQQATLKEFEHLMEAVPGLHACFWSVSDGDIDGKWCQCLIRQGDRLIHNQFAGGDFRKPSPKMVSFAANRGFHITRYIGDLSGCKGWADGKDSDRQFAINSGLQYLDVKEFIHEIQ